MSTEQWNNELHQDAIDKIWYAHLALALSHSASLNSSMSKNNFVLQNSLVL
jgi:hypothetical protein